MKAAGIEVRDTTVTVVIRDQARSGQPRELKHTPQGHTALVQVLRTASVTHGGGWSMA